MSKYRVLFLDDNADVEVIEETESLSDANRVFLSVLECKISNYEDYTDEDISEILEQEYERFGGCVLYIETDGIAPSF